MGLYYIVRSFVWTITSNRIPDPYFSFLLLSFKILRGLRFHGVGRGGRIYINIYHISFFVENICFSQSESVAEKNNYIKGFFFLFAMSSDVTPFTYLIPHHSPALKNCHKRLTAYYYLVDVWAGLGCLYTNTQTHLHN